MLLVLAFNTYQIQGKYFHTLRDTETVSVTRKCMSSIINVTPQYKNYWTGRENLSATLEI